MLVVDSVVAVYISGIRLHLRKAISLLLLLYHIYIIIKLEIAAQNIQ